MASAAAILVDWGTTNFRAWLAAADGTVLDTRQAPCGIMQVAEGDFPATLERQAGDWRAAQPGLPVLMAGMVGSRQGWVEAPYAATPAGIEDLVRGIIEIKDAPAIHIVPGMSCRSDDGRHDVMRGEEVQIFGAIDHADALRQVLCLPGTHSKWAVVEGGRVTWFATAMTGEVYSVLAGHSILGRLMAGQAIDDDVALDRGFALSGTAGGLLNHLFAVRSEGLFGAVRETGLRSLLSGILIGHEVRAMMAVVRPEGTVTVVGRPDVARLYEAAIAATGGSAIAVDAETSVLRGLLRIRELMASG